MELRHALIKLNWLLSSQFGMDTRHFLLSLRGIPRFIGDWRRFRRGFSGKLSLMPCLYDWYEESGSTRSEYFWQDLLVARWIFEARPERHLDIGSRVDGFVAHVASFRQIEVLDVRKAAAQIPGIKFIQTDLMQPVKEIMGCCDSLSCLHALEHFGLGRYGDPIDPAGFERGIVNMSDLLKEGGTLYLSVPVGIDRVEFNAHRVFDPRVIVNRAERCSLRLKALTVIGPDGICEDSYLDMERMAALANRRYALGIFTFEKRSAK